MVTVDEVPLTRFRRQRRHRLGSRRYQIHFMATGQLFKSLQNAADARHRSIGSILEKAAWSSLGRMAAREGAKLFGRLRYADALISQVANR